jgi:acetyl esterase/lipase
MFRSATVALFLLFVSFHSEAPEGEAAYSKRDYIYKTVGDCAIHITVFRNPGDQVRPAVLYIHGGGLIMGSRADLPLGYVEHFLRAGFVVFSMDYRLAPQTRLPDIAHDLEDAYKWVRSEGVRTCKIDPDRIVIGGTSSGAYLALLSGIRLSPRPKVIFSMAGYSDLTAEWYNRPLESYRRDYPLFSKQEAYKVFDGPIISEAPWEKSPTQWNFVVYCRQQGSEIKELTGHDPASEPNFFDQFCVLRHLTADYPPTILIHGDHDSSVPYQESVEMAQALRQHHVDCSFIIVTNGIHELDQDYVKGTFVAVRNPVNDERFERLLAFLLKHVR